MKKLALTVVIVAAIITSCVKEPVSKGPEFVKGKPVTVSVAADVSDPAVTRSYPGLDEWTPTANGHAKDRVISSFRVLIFETQGAEAGKLRWNIPFDLTGNPTSYNLTIETGTFHFVFIANEKSDNNLETALDNLAVGTATYTGLNNIIIAGAAFSPTVDIPMMRVFEDVKVIDGSNIEDSSGTSVTGVTGTWKILMERVAIRLSIKIDLTAGQYNRWKNASGGGVINIKNIAGNAYLMPDIDNAGTASGTSQNFTATLVSGLTFPLTAGDPALDILVAGGGVVAVNTDGSATVFYDRLIMPELLFSPKGDPATPAPEPKALEFSMLFDGGNLSERFTAYINAPPPPAPLPPFGYTLPRNTWLHLDIDIDNNAGLQIQPNVLPWNYSDNVPEIEGKYFLMVNKSTLIFPNAGSTEELKITTNYPAGWRIDLSTLPDWINTVSPLSQTVPNSATGGITLAFTAETNPSPISTRTAAITIIAGNMSKVVTIRQVKPVEIVASQIYANKDDEVEGIDLGINFNIPTGGAVLWEYIPAVTNGGSGEFKNDAPPPPYTATSDKYPTKFIGRDYGTGTIKLTYTLNGNVYEDSIVVFVAVDGTLSPGMNDAIIVLDGLMDNLNPIGQLNSDSGNTRHINLPTGALLPGQVVLAWGVVEPPSGNPYVEINDGERIRVTGINNILPATLTIKLVVIFELTIPGEPLELYTKHYEFTLVRSLIN